MATYERIAIDALGLARMLPGSWEKRFARDMAGTAEDYVPTPKQREFVWKLSHRYRRQMPQMVMPECKRWLAMDGEEKAFRNALLASPMDYGLRLVYADWLDDRGDKFADVQRWMVERSTQLTLKPCGQAYGSNGNRGINYEWYFGHETWKDFSVVSTEPNYLSRWHRSQEEAERNLMRAINNAR